MRAVIASGTSGLDACTSLIRGLRPNAPWPEEYAFRIWQAYRYLMLHQQDWIKAGLQSQEGKIKPGVLISLWRHFSKVDLPNCGMMDFPVTVFIYGANRITKDVK